MPKKLRKHKLRHLRSALAEPHWAIHPPSLAEMNAILDSDAGGHELGSEVISRRLGMARPGDSRMQVVNGVATIPITGVLQPKPNVISRYFGGTATSQVEADFRRAVGDSQVRAIVLLVDSPGGSAIGNEEVSQTIFAARGKKPITSYVRGMAASAAYYLASAADKIIASPSSSVGSIGTIYVHADFSEALKEFGIEVTNVTYGQHKADGSPFTKFDDQGRKTVQEYVDAYGNQFARAVARYRGVSVAEVREQFGQGKVFLAQEARRRGMIDAIGAMDSLTTAQSQGSEDERDDFDDIAVAATAFGSLDSSSLMGLSANAHDTNHTAATAADFTKEETEMDKKIKAALFARGLIADIDASDEVCQAALAGYFRGNVPENQDEVLQSLTSSQPAATGVQQQATGTGQQQATGQQSTDTSQNASATSANVQAAHDREVAEARAEAVRQDRQRRQNIEASGRLLGMSQEQVRAAIDSEDDHDQIIARWHQEMANQEPPVDTGHVNVTGEGADRFAVDAVDALLLRSGFEAASEQPSHEASRLQSAPLAHVARQCLSLSGRRADALDDPEQVALDALQMSGSGVAIISAAASAYNRPGDFPNLLSALAGKMLDQAIQIAEPTYPIWTGKLPDLADFKPKTIVGLGHFDELDEIMDDEDTKQLQMSEEAVGWIQAGRYANKVGLTPTMVANDDLDAFTQGLRTLAMAHEHTLNRLCLALITGNVTLLDGNALFDDTNHGNDVTSGGAPSQAQVEAMRLKHRLQTGIGDVGRVRTPPRYALVPPSLEEAAEQVLLPLRFLPEEKAPRTDATINVHRGKVLPVTEPDLEDSSSAVWYTFADPRIRRSIVHAFQRGYGRGGRRTRWFDPNRKTMYVDLEGRFAAAVAGHRGAVRNTGS